jgi:hypothetical protein
MPIQNARFLSSNECDHLCTDCWSRSWHTKSVTSSFLVLSFQMTSLRRFTPEQLGMHATSVLVWNTIEICLLCLTCYILNVQSKLRTLDLIAYCGYKYVGMIAALASYLATHSTLVYRCALLYVSITLCYFLVCRFVVFFTD